jgi:hypothetical protein
MSGDQINVEHQMNPSTQNPETVEQFLDNQATHVTQCVREARFVAVLIVVMFCWIVTVVVSQGYLADQAVPPKLIVGIPSWVVWGLILPWLFSIAATWFFAIFVLQDDDYVDLPDEFTESPKP